MIAYQILKGWHLAYLVLTPHSPGRGRMGRTAHVTAAVWGESPGGE